MPLTRTRALMAVVLLGMTVVGCCKEAEQQLADLQIQYNDLSSQNKDLRSRVASAKAQESELLAQLSAKDMELAAVNSKLKAAQEKTSSATVAPRGWEVGLTADKVTVGSDILFSPGRASLTSSGKIALGKIVRDLKSTYASMGIHVYGHTDSDPIKKTKKLWQDNLDLSANRAMAVTRYLISKGIKDELIETTGMGDNRPVTSNASKAGKAKNRRVEIVVIKKP